jgi:hypothetical protein
MLKRPVLGLALTCALLPAACRPRPSAGDAGPVSDGGPGDAGTPVVLQLGLEVRLPDGGVVGQPLDPAAPPFLPVTQALDITANLGLRNYRLRLLDEIDRVLASDDVPEELPSGLRYHVALLSPLRAGHRYTVLLDAQSGPTLDDGRGNPLAEQRFEFRTEGVRDRDAPTKRSKTKRRHPRGGGP